MHIDQIEINNLLGLRHARFDMSEAPVTLICGHNGAGKSTVRDGLRFALTGDPGRVSLKKEYGSLLTEGAKTGTVRVDSEHGAIVRNVQDGKQAAAGGNVDDLAGYDFGPALPLILDADTFARQPVDERRRQLFAIAGIDMDHIDVVQRVRDRGLTGNAYETLLDDALPKIRTDGFDGGHQHCKEAARQAKANWRAVTGENYGAKKAEGWQSEAVDFDANGHKKAVERQKAVQHRIGELRETIGGLRAQAQASVDDAERERLQDLADRVAARQQHVADLERKLAEARGLEEAEQQAAEKSRRQNDADNRDAAHGDAITAVRLQADGITFAQASAIVMAIDAGDIPRVSISY